MSQKSLCKASIFALAGVVGLVASRVPALAEEGQAAPYRLLPADQISVTLPLNPEINATGPIGPDGRFSMPLVGRLSLGGETIDQAEKLIADALRTGGIVADAKPNIAVSVYAAAVYVAGEVRTPGPVALNRPLDTYQAVVVAGGLLDTARTGKIAVIRRSSTGMAVVHIVNLHDYPHNAAGPTLVLAPGDVVFVPKTRIAEIDKWIDQHINKVVPQSLHFNVNLGDTTTSTSAIVTP